MDLNCVTALACRPFNGVTGFLFKMLVVVGILFFLSYLINDDGIIFANLKVEA